MSLLSVKELASEAGVDPDQVLAWIASKELRAINVAISKSARRPTWRVRRDEWERFLEARSNGAAPAPRKRRIQEVPRYV